MEKSQVKPNDIFVATFNAPDASMFDFVRSGINAANTSLYKKEDYQNTPFVKKRFTDEKGVFNQDAFDKAYEKAYQNYQQLADENALQGLKEYLTYGKESIYKPYNAKEQDTSYRAETFKNNPLNRSIGITGLNQKSDPKFTEEEAAQTNRIWDSKNKKWLNVSAEDRNIFRKAFGETLVYAKYDKTGEQVNPVTGERGYHYKGEWIKDENGNYFTETLGDRQLLDKQVVALGDILTKEGSALNKFDFWDSDGYDKSISGIAMKTIVNVLPYVTPLRGYYGAFTMAMQIAASMPALYKSLESIASGENQSGLTPTMTSLENWFAKWDGSKSHKGRESFWNIESLGELVADTFGQLYQQRAAATLAPKVLAKFDPDLAKAVKYQKLMEAGKESEALALNAASSLKKMNEVSSGLTFAYLGLTQGADMYNETLKAGYDRRTAGIASLATMASLFGIMKYNEGKNGLGTWFLDKTTGYTRDVDRAIVTSTAKKELNNLRNEIQKAVVSGDRNKLAYTLKEWKRKGASALHDAFVIGGEDLWKGFLVEGVEEVTEEATQDLVKGLVDTMSWLGYTQKQGSFGGWDNVFSKEGMSRYLSTFVGGGLGGALFSAQNKWINPAVDQLFGVRNGRPDANQQRENYELAEIILDGRFDEYMKELDNCKKFIKNSLDATVVAEGDNDAYNISTQGESQADLVVKLAKQKALTMKNLLEGAVGNFDQLSDFEKRFIASHFASIYGSKGNNFDKEYLNAQFTKAAERILSARESLATFDNKESKDLSAEEKVQKEEAKKELDAAVDEFKNFFDAKHYALYSIDGAILGNPKLSKALMNTSLEDYARNVFQQDITKLEDQKLKDRIKEEWETTQQELTKENMVDVVPRLRNLFLQIFNSVSPEISQFTDDAQVGELIKYIHHLNENPDAIQEELFLALTEEINANDPLAQQKYREIQEQIYNNSFTQNLLLLAKIKPEFLSIGPRHDFDLYVAIKPALTIDPNGKPLSAEAENIIIQTINEQASRSSIDIWTPEHVQEFINSIQSIFDDKSNIYRRRLDEQRRADLPEDQQQTAVLVPIELNLDVTKIPENIRSVKINSLRDFANQFDVIDSELREHLAGMYLQDIIDRAERVGDLNINSEDPEIAEMAKNFLSEELELKKIKLEDQFKLTINKTERTFVNSSNIERLKNLLEIAKLKSGPGDKVAQVALDSLFQIQRDPLTEAITQDSQWLADVTSLINMPVVENPIVKALKKLYVGVNESESGKDIFDFLADKNKTINTYEGLNKELSLSDTNVLESAAKTLDLVLTVLDASVGTRISLDPRTGLHSVIEGGIIDYGKHFLEMSGEDSSKFKPISDTGARLSKGYIYDLIGRLNQLKWFNAELGAYKNKLDEEARRQYMIGFAHDLLTKEINIGLNHKISALTPEEIPDDEEQCENAIELRLQEISVKFAELLNDEKFIEEAKTREKPKSPEQYLIDCILENFKSDDFVNPIQKANNLYTWDWKTKSGKSNQYWLAKRLVECIIKDRKTIQKDIYDILSFEEQAVYPKFDQMLDIEELLYQAYDIASKGDNVGVLYYFNSQVIERNKKISGQKSELNLLPNTIALLGGPGAGKSFLLKICKDKLQSILGGEFKVSAVSQKKVEDLKKDTKSEGNIIDGILEDINSGLKASCDTIDTALKEISKSYNEKKLGTPNLDTTVRQEELKKFIESIPNKSISRADAINDKSGNIIGVITTIKSEDITVDAEFYFERKSVEKNGSNVTTRPATLSPIITLKNELKSNLDYHLMIDESTLVSPTKLLVLGQIAKQNKKMSILSGDHGQLGYLVDSGDQKADFSYYEIFCPNSAPMLISSYRFTSNIKTNNISKIASVREQWEHDNNYGINSSNLLNQSQVSTLKENLEKVPLDWQVFRSGSNNGIFIGDKIDSNKTQFDNDLNGFLIPEIQKGKTLAVISENSTDEEEIKNILKDKGLDIENKDQIEFLKVADVQGGEYDYVISYKLKKSPSQFDLDFDVAKAYTVLSRSKYGTLVLDEADGLFKSSGINSNPQESKDGVIFDSNDSVANDKRKQRVQNIISLLEEYNPTPEPEKPAESKEKQDLQDPTIEDPEPDKSEDDKDGSQKTNDTLRFFKKKEVDTSILQAWYTRLGINWRNSNTYLEQCKNSTELESELKKEGELSDLCAYYKAREKEYFNKTVHELAQDFLAEKNRMLEKVADEGFTLRYRYWCKAVNKDEDYPYAKFNHDNGSLGTHLQLIQVYDDQIKGWVTIGKLGYNLDENKKPISNKQAEYFETYKDSAFEFTLNRDLFTENIQNAISEYLQRRNLQEKPYNSGVIRYTSLRDYKLDQVLIARESLPNSPEFSFYNKIQIQFSRLTVKEVLLLGYEIDSDYWDPNSTQNTGFDAFKRWYNDYREFEPVENWNKFKGLENRVWIVLKQKGTGYKFPILVNKIQSNYASNIPSTEKGNIKGFGYTQIARALKHLIKQSSLENKDSIISRMEEKSENDTTPEAIRILQIIKDEWDNSKVGEVLTKALDDENLKEELFKDGVGFFQFTLDQFNSVSNLNVEGSKLGVTFHKNDELSRFKFIQQLSEKLEGFFFTTDTNSVRNQIESMKNSNEYVVSRFFETPRYFFFWDAVEIVNSNSTSGPQELTDEQVFEELNKDLGFNNSTELIDYINLLDPKLGSISGLYKSVNRNNLIEDIRKLKENDILQVLSKDIDQMNDAEKQDYRQILSNLKLVLSKYSNITKKIDEKLQKCIPSEGMSLEEFGCPALNEVVKRASTPVEGQVGVQAEYIFNGFKGLAEQMKEKTFASLNNTTLTQLHEIIKRLKPKGLKLLFDFNATKNSPSKEDIDMIRQLYKTKC